MATVATSIVTNTASSPSRTRGAYPLPHNTRTVQAQFPSSDWNTQYLTSSIHQRSREGQCHKALDLFRELAHGPNHHEPNVLFSSLAPVVRCCAKLGGINAGREIHGFMVRRNQFFHVDRRRSESSLIRVYAGCGFLRKARQVFDRMLERDVVAWTIMLMAYADHEGHEDEMWCLLQQMLSIGVVPNKYAITTMLRCVGLDRGRQVHSQVVKRSWESEAFVGSAMVGMYARSGVPSSAQVVFDRIEEKDEVCFNTLISSYGRIGKGNGLLSTFVEMGLMGLLANQSTYVGMLNGCAVLGSLNFAKQLHACATVSGYASDSIIQAVLIDTYAKCGTLEAAHAIFDRMDAEKSVHVWNSIIGGYGKHGYAEEALRIFALMEASSASPDYITFICLLSACSHCGLIHEGWRLYKLMTDSYKIPARSEHYCCMVDLMGRAGMTCEAYEFLCGLGGESVGASVWGALLSSCRTWGDIDKAEIATKRLFELDSGCSSSYVALAGTLAASGQHDDANLIRELMDERGVKKDAGCSWIEVDGRVHKFRAGQAFDKHPIVKDKYSFCEGHAEL